MQQPICNPVCGGVNSIQKILHLKSEASDEMFNDGSMLTSDSDKGHSSSDEFNINFSKNSSQDFGLGYYLNHTKRQSTSPLPCHNKSDKSICISKSTSGIKPPYSASLSQSSSSSQLSYQMPKGSRKKKSDHFSRKNGDRSSQLKSTKIKYKDPSDIPRLKIPKQVIRKYLKTLSPSNSSQSSSSDSDTTCPPSSHKHDTVMPSQSTYKTSHHRRRSRFNSDCKSSSSSASSSVKKINSSCLEKSFENSTNSIHESNICQVWTIGRDIMHLTFNVDRTLYKSMSKFPRPRSETIMGKTRDSEIPQRQDQKSEILLPHDIRHSRTKNSVFYPESNGDSLSFCCDIRYDEKKKKSDCFSDENQQRLSQDDSVCKQVNKTPIVNNSRKRNIDPLNDDNNDDESVVSAKRKPLQSCPVTDNNVAIDFNDKCVPEMSPIDFLKFLTARLKKYENIICEKYCLSQPNAMKFLAQNHAANWESNRNVLHQMHLVPCELLNEIFHRALHCYGLEKKVVRETMAGSKSPIDKCDPSNSVEYKKIRDEYSFSLKRVRYGIGVIDELFRRKVNYQSIPTNNDVPIVRKWKHIIYYLCLHAKSAFMAKEIQYQNYIQLATNSFDGAIELCSSSTPSVRSLSVFNHDMYNKPQLSKESSKLFDCKLNPKTSPDHFSHSDMEASPHSYDSGKGSSIRMSSSNANSLVSGCHTTSSVNSTPHSLQDPQLNLPGYQWFRIDEYQSTANDYIRLLPDASHLHQKIVSRIGTEPNANSRDNIVKLIFYIDIVLSLSRDELLTDCLQRLVGQAMPL